MLLIGTIGLSGWLAALSPGIDSLSDLSALGILGVTHLFLLTRHERALRAVETAVTELRRAVEKNSN